MHVIRQLEREGRLDRAIEFLPSDEVADARRQVGQGLTHPELAVVLSYAKMWVYEHLLQSDVPENAYFERELSRYFPRVLCERC